MSARSGFSIDDDDLVECDTVRDAVECVVGARLSAARRPRQEHACRADARLDRARRIALGWRASPTASLLLRSLAHRSWCAEHGESESNERLEFLGDSVLGLVVTHYVFEHFPTCPRASSPKCAPAS